MIEVKKFGLKNSRTAQSSAMDLVENITAKRGTIDQSKQVHQLSIIEQQNLESQFARCPECHTEFNLTREIDQFPLNQALLSLAVNAAAGGVNQHQAQQSNSTNQRKLSFVEVIARKTPMKSAFRLQLDDDQTTLKNNST